VVSLDNAVVARLSRFGTDYQILCDPEGSEAVLEKLRVGDVPDIEISAIMAIDDVFTHHADGTRASDEELEKAFNTTDVVTVARRILKEGEIQLTSEQRKKMTEQKYNRVLGYIMKHAWNPQTRTPHPRERIERALVEAKFRVDPMRHIEEQAQEALQKLRPLLPIAFEKVRVAIRVPAEHTGTAYGVVRSVGDMQKEEWQNDGSLIAVIEIPAGSQTEVYDRLNQVTHGSVETKLL